MLFMLVLLLQSSFAMFNEHADPPEMRNFDIIMRTSSASIFGYFLSANFGQERGEEEPLAQTSPQRQTKPVLPPDPLESALPAKPDGAAVSPLDPAEDVLPVGENKPPALEEVPPEKPVQYYVDPRSRHLQIVIATGIGLFSLLILLQMRYFGTMTQNSVASISQFRDFVSGCVGFLIGSARGNPIGSN